MNSFLLLVLLCAIVYIWWETNRHNKAMDNYGKKRLEFFKKLVDNSEK